MGSGIRPAAPPITRRDSPHSPTLLGSGGLGKGGRSHSPTLLGSGGLGKGGRLNDDDVDAEGMVLMEG